MSKLLNGDTSKDVLDNKRDISNKEIILNSIIKDSLLEDGTEFNSLNLLNNREESVKKHKYLKSHKKEKKKKKRVLRFRLDLIEEVEIESYKEHNQKMCFREIEEDDEKNGKDCRSCLEKLCLIF
jgi:hypothetical protein